MPKRIQRKRTKGWRMPDGACYVGRPTQWGNPFYVGCHARIGGKLGGGCTLAGTEHCDFDCPFRDNPEMLP